MTKHTVTLEIARNHKRLARRLAALEVADERAARFHNIHSGNFEKVAAWQKKRLIEMTAMIMEAHSIYSIEMMLATGARPAGC